MVSTPERFTDNIPMSHRQSETVTNSSARKSLYQFLDTLESKPKTAVYRFISAKSDRKSIRSGSILWSIIPKRRLY